MIISKKIKSKIINFKNQFIPVLKKAIHKNNNSFKKEHNLFMLRGQITIFLESKEKVEKFEFCHSIPISYNNQIPVLIKTRVDPKDRIINKKIEKTDDYNLNLNIKFHEMKKGQKITINIYYWVIIYNKIYFNLTEGIYKSKNLNKNNLSIWTSPTESIQSDNILIRLLAFIIKINSKRKLNLIKRISYFTCFHKPILSLLRHYLEVVPTLHNIFLTNKYWTGLSDALSFLFIGGLCGGKSNFMVALIRANNIPSRVLITTPMYYGKNVYIDAQHTIIEFYSTEHGWIPAMPGAVPYESKNFIILKIVTITDENNSGNAFSYYGRMHPWFWISNNNVKLGFPENLIDYGKLKGEGVPAVKGWIDQSIYIEYDLIDDLCKKLKKSWDLFVKVSNMNLAYINYEKFEKAENEIYEAILSFKKSNIEKFNKHISEGLEKLSNFD